MVPSSEKHDATLSATSIPLSSTGVNGMLLIIRLVMFPQNLTAAQTLPTPSNYIVFSSHIKLPPLTITRKGKGGASNIFMHRSSEQGQTRMSKFRCSSWDA